MAANLTPQYLDAEANYKKARTTEEKLQWLRTMWVEIPKHKASEKLQAILKTKISELNDELEQEKAGPKKGAGPSYKIPKQGAGQFVFLGAANAGKSRLLRTLTKAQPEVAPYPFTTREAIPGMMDFEEIRFQLIDTPPITADFYEHYITDLTRIADAALLFCDLGDDDGPFSTETVVERLQKVKRELVGKMPEMDDDPTIYHLRTLLVCTKADAEGAMDRMEIVKEMFEAKFPMVIIAAEANQGLDELKKKMFETLQIMRLFSKMPGKPAEMTAPFTIPIGGTVIDMAEKVHQDLAEKVKSARVWGSAEFDGQTVGKDHVLRDRDIVELHT
jgi:uncharacterized protein